MGHTVVQAQNIDESIILLTNGNIMTINHAQPNATAMAMKGGKILAIGDFAEVKEAAGNSCEYVDLEGSTVTPGFIETHAHLVNYGSYQHH
jgi:predicted amidohydrolase YtcJ